MAGSVPSVRCAAVVLAAFFSLLAARQAEAAPPPSKVSEAASRALTEIANEAGYRNWAAYVGAREAEAIALQKEGARIVADSLTFGRRVEREFLTGDDLEAIGFTEWVIDFTPPGAFYMRTGLDVTYPGILGFGAKTVRTTFYWSNRGEQLGKVSSEIKDGVETITDVEEYLPGSIDLKKGDTRQAPKPASSTAGLRPSTFDPKKDGSLGRSSGGTSPLPGILDAVVAEAEAEKKQAPDASQGTDSGSPDDKGSDPGAAPGTAPGGAPAAADSSKEGHWEWSEPSHDDETGVTHTAYVYRDADGNTSDWGVKTEKADGSTSCKSTTSGEDMDCPDGMTDEPNCRSDCARLAVLAALFGLDPDPTKEEGAEITATATSVRDTHGFNSGASDGTPRYRNADKSGAPKDYGDPSDPRNADPIDWGDMFYRLDRGDTDPLTPDDCAEIIENSIALEMSGVLYDPANPPGSGEEAPPGDQPDPGSTE